MKKIFILILNTLLLSNALADGNSSSGGGQSVMTDRNIIRFVDSLTPEELDSNAFQLISEEKYQEVISSITCAEEKLLPMRDSIILDKILDEVKFEAMMWPESLSALETDVKAYFKDAPLFISALPIAQLKDASSIDPKFQIQAAYHETGVTYFQAQIIQKIPRSDLRDLMTKEAIRFIHQLYLSDNKEITNFDVEELVRNLRQKDFVAAVNSKIVQALHQLWEPEIWLARFYKKEIPRYVNNLKHNYPEHVMYATREKLERYRSKIASIHNQYPELNFETDIPFMNEKLSKINNAMKEQNPKLEFPNVYDTASGKIRKRVTAPPQAHWVEPCLGEKYEIFAPFLQENIGVPYFYY